MTTPTEIWVEETRVIHFFPSMPSSLHLPGTCGPRTSARVLQGERGPLSQSRPYTPGGCIRLLEINLHDLGYRWGRLFKTTVKFVCPLVKVISRPLPGNYCVLLINEQTSSSQQLYSKNKLVQITRRN